jgi:hypothetical protein
MCCTGTLRNSWPSSQDILELFRFIDWVMILPEELEEQFSDGLVQYEEEMKMPYVTSVERLGRARGRMEGRTEGRSEGLQRSREALLGILEARFGCTPDPSVANPHDRGRSQRSMKILRSEGTMAILR